MPAHLSRSLGFQDSVSHWNWEHLAESHHAIRFSCCVAFSLLLVIHLFFLGGQRLAARLGRGSWGGEGKVHKDAVFSPWRLLWAETLFLSSASGPPPLRMVFATTTLLLPLSSLGLIKVQRLAWLFEFLPEIGNLQLGNHELRGLLGPPLCARQSLGDPASAPARHSGTGVQPVGLGTRTTARPGQDLQVGCTKVWRVGTP